MINRYEYDEDEVIDELNEGAEGSLYEQIDNFILRIDAHQNFEEAKVFQNNPAFGARIILTQLPINDIHENCRNMIRNSSSIYELNRNITRVKSIIPNV